MLEQAYFEGWYVPLETLKGTVARYIYTPAWHSARCCMAFFCNRIGHQVPIFTTRRVVMSDNTQQLQRCGKPYRKLSVCVCVCV